MLNPVGWFEIYVSDMSRARRFYEGVLDVTLEDLTSPVMPEVKMMAFPGDRCSYGSPGSLVCMPGYPTGQNSVIVYFSCNDCTLELDRVVKFGGSIFKNKFAIGQYGYIALINDTEGNMIGLHSMK